MIKKSTLPQHHGESKKRKRKEGLIMNDVPSGIQLLTMHGGNKLLEKIQKY